jgi:hypothetical protein
VNLNNPPKFYGVLVAMILLSTVFALDKLTESAYVGLMGLLVGYLVGNGIAATRGEPVEPMLGESASHRVDRQRAADQRIADEHPGEFP